MAFDKFVIFLISPLGTALVGVPLAVVLARRARRLASALAVACWAWLWLCSTPAFSNLLVGAVERSVPYIPLQLLPRKPAMLVLGGGVEPPQHAGHLPHLNSAAARVWYAARLYKAGKASLVVLSGGDGNPGVDLGSEASAMRSLLLDLGVPSQAIILENRSLNTRQNAAYSAAILGRLGINNVLLVTSALHMRRALAQMRKHGLHAIPAATDFEARRKSGIRAWLPQAGALRRSAYAIKETVGWLAGR